MAKIRFNNDLKIDTPVIILKRRDYTNIDSIKDACEIVYKDNYNSPNELSFKVYKKSNTTHWDEINDYNIIYIPDYGENGEYFDISVRKDEDTTLYKTITCTSLAESELSNIKLYEIEINTEEDIARDDYDANYPTIFYRDLSGYDKDSDMYKKLYNSSLLHRLLDKASNYSIGYIAPTLKNLSTWYQFSISDTDIYTELTGEVAENYQCRFVFDSHNRTVNAYDLCNSCNDCGYRGDFHNKCPECGSTNFGGSDGEDTTILISKDNLSTSASVESNKDNLKNCFRVSGGDDTITAAIMTSNPSGSNYIYCFSDEMLASMPDDLKDKISSYETKYNEYFNTKTYSIGSSIAENYNSVVTYVKNYYPDEEYNTITSSVVGYDNLTTMIYDAIDLALYIQSGMMKTPEVEGQGIDDAIALLTANNLGNIAVSSPSTTVKTIVENAILGVCKLYINTALYKISIADGSTYTQGDTGTWIGKFTLTSIEDSTETVTSDSNITLSITNDEETFLKQKIEKALAQSDNTYKPLQTRVFDDDFTLNDFKTELRYYSINYLQALYDEFADCLSVILDSNNAELQTKYKNFYTTYRNAIEAEIVTRTTQLGYVHALYDYGTDEDSYGTSGVLADIIEEIEEILNFETYLGEDLWKVFCSYRREDSYSNDNYISDGLSNAEIVAKAKELLNAATKELYKAANMQYTVTANINNLLALEEFTPITDKFECGNWIHLLVDETVYDLRLLSYQISYDDIATIDVEFSTVEKIWSGMSDVKSILASASSMASQYSYTIQKIKNNTKSTKYVNQWVDSGFDATANKIVNNADNVGVVFDRTGITLARYDDIEAKYSPYQTKILDTGLYVTDDNWETVKSAIGKYYYTDPETGKLVCTMGVLADTIVGKVILGETLGLYNEDNTLKFDNDGFSVISTDEKSFVKFYKDENGDYQISISTDNFKFSSSDKTVLEEFEIERKRTDELVADNVIINDKITAAEGSIDDLTTDNVTINERLTANEGDIKTLTADNVTINEKLTANEADIDTLQADYANVNELVAQKASIEDLAATNAEITNLKADYEEVNTLVAKKASIDDLNATNAEITNIKADYVKTETLEASYITADDISAKYATITKLESDYITADTIASTYVTTDTLTSNYITAEVINAKYATIESLDATNAKITNLETSKLSADDAKITYATITNLNAATADIEDLKTTKLSAETAELTYATIDNLTSAFGRISQLESDKITTNYLQANQATIDYLNSNYLTASQIETDYIQADLGNFTTAMVGTLLAQAGLISTATISEGHVTGYLDSVEINANDITAGTLTVDRLVISGSDKSIMYAINNSGDLVSTNVDTIDGGAITKRSISAEHIIAESITSNELHSGSVTTDKILTGAVTADKITVTDLSALDATIGGYHITSNAIYSGSKASASNTSTGVYMDNIGQFVVGDSSNHIKYYLDSSDGKYKLEITAEDITIGSSDSSLIQELENIKDDVTITLNVTASNGIAFKDNTGSTVLTAHVYRAGVEQTITDSGLCGELGQIKWYKGTSTAPIATTKTLTISASDVDNLATYTCQLEG